MTTPGAASLPPTATPTPATPSAGRYPTLHAAGVAVTVDRFAWERDPAVEGQMRLWLVSLLGPQQAIKALWAWLLKGKVATLQRADFGAAHLCALAPEGRGGFLWRTAALPERGAHHGVCYADAARFLSDRPHFLILPPAGNGAAAEAARLHYLFLNRRVDVPLHAGWAGWLFERALRAGEAVALDGFRIGGFLCRPDERALRADLSAAVRAGRLTVPTA